MKGLSEIRSMSADIVREDKKRRLARARKVRSLVRAYMRDVCCDERIGPDERALLKTLLEVVEADR